MLLEIMEIIFASSSQNSKAILLHLFLAN